MIVDNFAGGGGASSGIEAALGRAIDIAINHDEDAIRMHEANHPDTKHIRNNIWQIDPKEVTQGKPVRLAWFSPDCKHFSKAKGGKPLKKNIRDLAWVVVLWAQRVRPDVIMLENVEEFRTWGPLCVDGKPIKERSGETFAEWTKQLHKAGYKTEWKELRACDYGAPTIRKRFFMIARSDGNPIVWPKPTHGDPKSAAVKSGKLLPWRTAADIIDWTIPCPSIFGRKKPLAEKTMRRIAAGIMKFVVHNPSPFLVPDQPASAAFSTYAQHGGAVRSIEDPMHTITASRKDHNCLVTALLRKFGHIEQANGGPKNLDAPGRAADTPLSTITMRGTQQRIVTTSLMKMRGTARHGQPVTEPLHTISAQGQHFAEVRAFLIKYYGNEQDGHNIQSPLGTITTKDRFGLVIVTIQGEEYVIVDIGMRMLTARELFNAQGFDPDYIIDCDIEGRPMTKTSQIARCGNSVSPPVAKALVAANFNEEGGIYAIPCRSDNLDRLAALGGTSQFDLLRCLA